MTAEADGLRVVMSAVAGAAPEPELFDVVLVATGRRPNGDRIGAEAAGLRVDARGFVPVDHEQRSNVRHLFAIGDLTGQPMLAHKASHEAKIAAEVAAGMRRANDARVIPSVAYTDPEVAWVGLTETEARSAGTAYERASFPWAASGRALGLGRDDGFTKLLFDPVSHRVLGAGFVGVARRRPGRRGGAWRSRWAARRGDLALTVHSHPTLVGDPGVRRRGLRRHPGWHRLSHSGRAGRAPGVTRVSPLEAGFVNRAALSTTSSFSTATLATDWCNP